jgi:pyruvate dehydrogenase E1 component alpha subunit
VHGLGEGPSLEVELTRDDVLAFYRQMNAIREMELAARELYQSKKIRGFLHLFVGQVCTVIHYDPTVT